MCFAKFYLKLDNKVVILFLHQVIHNNSYGDGKFQEQFQIIGYKFVS